MIHWREKMENASSNIKISNFISSLSPAVGPTILYFFSTRFYIGICL